MKTLYCKICGNIVEVLQDNGHAINCCGQEMIALEANVKEAAKEKHIPVVEKISNGYRVTVGAVAHPMEDKHLIQWINLHAKDGRIIARSYLKAGDKPEASFVTSEPDCYATEHCNLHGLWKN